MSSASTTAAAVILISLFAPTSLANKDISHAPLHKRDLTAVGCYSSSAPLTKLQSWTYQSSGWCTDHCANSVVIGLTNGDTCYCGNEIPAASSKVDDSNCNIGCTGYGKTPCGGDGFWTVYTLQDNVATFSGSSDSSTASSSASTSTPSNTQATSSTSNPPTVVTSQVSNGQTIRVTITPSATPDKSSGGGTNVGGIVAGVVVGVTALSAIIVGAFFFLRHQKRKQAEEDYRQRTQVADFMRMTSERKPPGTSYSGMSDERLDPEAGRRNSAGSLADNQDYSRRILRVANPDSS